VCDYIIFVRDFDDGVTAFGSQCGEGLVSPREPGDLDLVGVVTQAETEVEA
jgi:hypothetical protein